MAHRMSERIWRVDIPICHINEDLMKEISFLLIMNPGLDVDTRVVEKKSSHSKKSKTEKPVTKKSEVARKTKKGMDKLKKSKRAFTQSIYGWNVKKDGTLKPNWKEQAVIDEMRYCYYVEHMSRGRIAKNLNERKVKGKRGGKWQAGGVARVLSNDFHSGRNDFKKPKWFLNKKIPEMTWGKKPEVVP